ncbi:sensor histidine kinase [Streptomyces hiroshimensis]|uniref:histidine kinase n=1 Tax=Streptomyces hiroshimensis TaxID=66424 RepID=A0ABQ2ZBZ4_9ACTN|nr:histidine kinase [Streptomyces hiroshimensis]GGY07867.1 two-component sensor histidine kinase [Streptomyces hiroshimensis]
MCTPTSSPFVADTRKSRLHAGFHAWLHALLGAAAGLLPLAVAVPAAAVAPAHWPGSVRTGLVLVLWAVLCAAAGRPYFARYASVRLANHLLGTALPVPGRPAAAAEADARPHHRLRTGAWLVLHALLGGVSVVVSGFLLMAAVALPAVWLKGGDRITVFLPVGVAGGASGLWTLPAGALLLVLACSAGKGTAALFRRLAAPLLGQLPAERLAALEGQVRVLAQRNRLAQELHDSIGHTLTASTIQAAVAKELMDTDPAAARRALTGLEGASRAAMDDLDHVLGILREGRAPTSPPFSLADLHALVDRVRGTGTDVEADITGDLAGVPATVSREAYRIAQEGLTNALRHGAVTGGRSAPVGLRVVATAAWLEVEVANRIAGPSAHSLAGRTRRRKGQGVTGIAERVHLLRGEVSAGPDASGTGWLLAVRIPLRSTP